MVQFYEGAKSWNGAVSWYSKSWNGAIIEKNSNICEEKYNMIRISKQPAELLCLRAALFYLFPLDYHSSQRINLLTIIQNPLGDA